jgi:hypothetical protein
MNPIIENLEQMLQNSNSINRFKILEDVYNQIVPGPRGRDQHAGVYKDFMEAGTGNPLELVGYVYDKLMEFHLHKWADRVKTQYHIHDEHKGLI